jgi:UDP-glucose 4-epimerase
VATGAHLYGSSPSHPVREGDADEVHDVVAASPMALLTYLRAHRETHDVEFAMLVLSTVYGPRQRHGIVADLVERCWSGGECAVERDDVQSCDLVFVHDAVDAFVRAAERGSGLVVNVATGHETTVIDLHAAVARHVVAAGGPRSGPLARSGAPPRRPRRSALDPGRARIQLGWSPWTEVDDGIGQTVEAARP